MRPIRLWYINTRRCCKPVKSPFIRLLVPRKRQALHRPPQTPTAHKIRNRIHRREIATNELMAVSYTHLDVYKRQAYGQYILGDGGRA